MAFPNFCRNLFDQLPIGDYKIVALQHLRHMLFKSQPNTLNNVHSIANVVYFFYNQV